MIGRTTPTVRTRFWGTSHYKCCFLRELRQGLSLAGIVDTRLEAETSVVGFPVTGCAE